MPDFEFESSTPLSIKNLNIKRPLRPLTTQTNGRRRLDSFLKPATTTDTTTNERPLKSILKNRNYIPNTKEKPSKGLFNSLTSKLFHPTQAERPDEKINTPNTITETETRLKLKDEARKKIEYLEEQNKILEDQNLSILRANKANLLKKEMEKQDLEIQNQLLRREIDSLRSQLDKSNDSSIISSFNSKMTNYEMDNISKLTQLNDLYKDDREPDDTEMSAIRREIELRRQKYRIREDDLSEKISCLEGKIAALTSKIETPQPGGRSNDDNLLAQIKQILREESTRKRRHAIEFEDDETDANYEPSRKYKKTISECEQLSPIRL